MPAMSSISVTLDMSKALEAATRQLVKREVAIGIPGGSARKPEPGEKSAPPDNSLLGYIAEFGDDEKHIPARPFLLPGMEAAKPDIVSLLAKTGKAALDGSLSGTSGAVDKGLTAVGFEGVKSVKAVILSGTFAPLAPATIAARARGERIAAS